MSGLGVPLEGVEMVVTVADALGKVVEALDAGTSGDVTGNGVKKLTEALLEEAGGEQFLILGYGEGGLVAFVVDAPHDVLRNLIDGHGVIGRTGRAESVVAEVEQCAIDLFPEPIEGGQGTA